MASSDDQLVKNSELCRSLSENQPFEEKLANTGSCLEQGVDVNAAGVDTPQLLVEPSGTGPHDVFKNFTSLHGVMTHDVAQIQHSEDNETRNILPTSMKSVNDNALQNSTQSQTKKKRKNKTSMNDEDYLKRAGTSEIGGQLYETKLLSLVLLRALNDEQIEQFHLGTNISGIGAMDDICLRYQVRGQQRPVILFLQAKHRYNCEKGKLTVEDLKNISGDFSLRKYFESYLTIKDRFRVAKKDSLFKGDFDDVECVFVLYTSVNDCFTKKKMEREMNEKVKSLINTKEGTKAFQFDYDDDDIEFLAKITVIERFKRFGAHFLDAIFVVVNDESKIKSINNLLHVWRYHMVISWHVLQLCERLEKISKFGKWKFRPEFFDNTSEYLVALKQSFVKQLSTTQCDQSDITNDDVKNFRLVLAKPHCADSLSKLIGKLATYNNKTEKLHLIEVAAFRQKFNKDEYKTLQERFNEIITTENVINEAVRIKLTSLKIYLPLAFGNTDMTFREHDREKKQERMKHVADNLINLLNINRSTKIVEINDDVVGPGKTLTPGFIKVDGGIGGAVGNLLILDPVANMLKFDLDNEMLPKNAALFLSNLTNNNSYKPINEELSSYRIKININDFPKSSFNADEYDKTQAKYFLSNLWFCTNQAKENEVERILINHITRHYNNEEGSNLSNLEINIIFLTSHHIIQKWWMHTGKTCYLSKVNDIFKRAKLACNKNKLLKVVSDIGASKPVHLYENTNQTDTLMCFRKPEDLIKMFDKIFDISDTQDISINIRNENKKEIFKLLETAEKPTSDTVFPSNAQASLNYHSCDKAIPLCDVQSKLKYVKRARISGLVDRSVYEINLLSIIFIRALTDDKIENFLLGSNIDGIGMFRDICLRYQMKGEHKPTMLFIRVAYRKTYSLSAIDYYYLPNYIESYFMIKERFHVRNKDAMFQGNLDDVNLNFVVYVSGKNCIMKKKNEHNMSKNVQNILNTGNDRTFFQYDYDENDLDYLTSVIIKNKVQQMGAHFLDLIMSKSGMLNITLHNITINNLIANYHVIMRHDVLQPCRIQPVNEVYRIWEFRPEFFDSKNEFIVALREIFVKMLLTKRFDKSEIKNEDLEDVKLALKIPCSYTYSKLIGKSATYNNKTKLLRFVEDAAIKKVESDVEFKKLWEKFSQIKIDDNVINESIEIKLKLMKIKLPLSFGNVDMTVRDSKVKPIQKRIQYLAHHLIKLLEINKDTKILHINDDDVGLEKMIIPGLLKIFRGLVGNLLVLDTYTKMLKFDLDNEALPENAALFLRELEKYIPAKKELSKYRIRIDVNEFPKYSFDEEYRYVKRQVIDFMDKLWFSASGDKTDIIKEINKFDNVELDRNVSIPVQSEMNEEIQKWWQQPSPVPYLTKVRHDAGTT